MIIDYRAGQKFNHLTLAGYSHKFNGTKFWFAKCDCGNEGVFAVYDIYSGHTKSCGCFKVKKLGNLHRTHGMSESKEYRIWCQMRRRCYAKTHPKYIYYGGRGIIVCNRWLKSFENFYSDMGKCPIGYSIERKDNNGNYEPFNCKWASDMEQGKNKRSVRIVLLNGIKTPKVEAERILGICHDSIGQKSRNSGMTIQEATDYFAKKKGIANINQEKASDYIRGILCFAI